MFVAFAEAGASRRRIFLSFALLLIALIFPGKLPAQSVCDSGNGPLNPAQPTRIAPAEIIQKFSAREAIFKAAREGYGYTLNVDVQTLNNYGQVDGEYKQASEIMLADSGKRVEHTTFAPLDTLRKLSLSQDDVDDIHQRLAFSFTPEELARFSITYAGRQRVDELNTYVFDVSPKNAKKEKKLFAGRIWVDDQELVLVKTCGKPRADEHVDSTKQNGNISLVPVFVTYREQVDGQNWFITYAKADELMRFPRNFIHVREVVKFSGYKPLAKK